MLAPTPQQALVRCSAGVCHFSSRAKTLFPLYVGPEHGSLGHQGRNMHPGASAGGLAITLDASPFETRASQCHSNGAACAWNLQVLGQPLGFFKPYPCAQYAGGLLLSHSPPHSFPPEKKSGFKLALQGRLIKISCGSS